MVAAAKKPTVSEPIELYGIGKYGIIKDSKPHLIVPEAYSDGRNVRFTVNGIERFLGDDDVFGTPTVDPHFLMNVPSIGVNFWLYASLEKIYGYDGVTHTDLTRASGGDYNATDGFQWQGTILGGVPILNNGVDVPQYWTGLDLGNDFANLTAWPGTLRAKIIKAFGPYLIAFNLTDSGDDLPKAMQWSSLADPGTIPASWDYTDPTVDAGRRQLTDDKGGQILDAMLLGNQGIIYTEFATHVARFVGGIEIFTTDLLLKSSGLLTRGCVTDFKKGTGHFVVTQDDILVHQGTKDAQSIVDTRNRSAVFNELNPEQYNYAFVVENTAYQEVWFCYPTIGSTYPNLALVWNYRDNTQTFRDIDFNSMDFGLAFDDGLGAEWEDLTNTWEEAQGPWSGPSRNKLVASSVNQTKFYAVDQIGGYVTGQNSSYVERVGLAIDSKDRATGQPKGSIKTIKQLNRIWPKITGDESVQIQVASQTHPDGDVTWTVAQTFTPGVDQYLDVVTVGNLLGYRVQHNGVNQWYMEGIDFQIEVLARL